MFKWVLNESNKLRLNLSKLALSVISQDQQLFHAKSRTTFLNRIFKNFYLQSEASIAQHLVRRESEFAAIVDAARSAEPYRSITIRQFLDAEKKALVDKHTKYEKSHEACHHALSADVVNVLLSASVSEEAAFYTLPRYFQAVIEDYCRQPILEREAIYFSEELETIRNAIAPANKKEKPHQLEVCTYAKTRYLVHPYRIVPDASGNAAYLACYARMPQQNISEKIPCSFRIANLRSVHPTTMPLFISQDDQKNLDKLIRNQGVQFLLGENTEIRVRLTEEGVGKFNRHGTLRPTVVEKTEDRIYTFCCTEAQAQYYFVKLGADAEILSPATLREKFRQMYQQAAALYADF